MKYVIWVLLALLVVLQQDYWQWNNAELVWGFMPWALLWHLGISLAAALLWWLATIFCWPEELPPPTLVPAAQPESEDAQVP